MLVLLLLGSGRLLRTRLLMGPDGAWREDLWLPAVPAGPKDPDEPCARPELTSPLPINRCSLDSLMLLPGVGPVLAERIDAVRRLGLIFRNSSDLQSVKGIGPVLSTRLDTILDYTLHRPPAGTAQIPGKSQ